MHKSEKSARNRVRRAEPGSEQDSSLKKGFSFTEQQPSDKFYSLKKTALSSHLFSLVVFLCVLMGSFSMEAAIVNGGFENTIINPSDPILESTMAGWTVSPPGSTIVRGVDTGPPFGQWGLSPKAGSIAASFASDNNATGPGGSLTQAPLTTDLLKTYNVSMWIANPIQDAANFSNVFSVSWANSLITLAGSGITQIGATQTYIVTPETSWFQITAVVQGTGDPLSDLVISARNNNWATLVDEVIFAETPEPSTLVMLGTGAAIMGLRRRRQQRAS